MNLLLGYNKPYLLQDCEHTDQPVDNLGGYGLVLSYGYRHILPKEVLETATCPIVNLHIGYLPFNRGAHPNYWAHHDGTPHGVTIHLIDEGIDTGPIICQRLVEFSPDEKTYSQTYHRLLFEVEDLWFQWQRRIMSGQFEATPQFTFHKKADLPEIDWDQEI